jgi:hypothetical protein
MAVDLYDPKQKLYSAHPDMGAYAGEAKKIIQNAAEKLGCRDRQGIDTSFARTALYEAGWRIGSTSDVAAARAAVERLEKALVCPDPPNGLTQDDEGSFALGAKVWYLKLQRSTDQLLARDWPWRRPPSFLEPVNGPARMVTYLQDHCWSDVVNCGQDNRTELNEALSVIARLIIQGGQAGYLAEPNFYPVLVRFIRDWQDPETGFFGMTYIVEHGNTIRTIYLSLTFHVAHYLPHPHSVVAEADRHAVRHERRTIPAGLVGRRHDDDRPQQLRRG